MSQRCQYCGNEFEPSRYHPGQRICGREACRRRRAREYHRDKVAQDPDYAADCRASRQNWRERHPDYQRHYRAAHPAAAERNRARQRVRDALRRARRAVPAAAATAAVQEVAGPVWLVWGGGANLDRNNFVFGQWVGDYGPRRDGQNLDKNNLARSRTVAGRAVGAIAGSPATS